MTEPAQLFKTNITAEIGATAEHPPGTELDEHGNPVAKNEDAQ